VPWHRNIGFVVPSMAIRFQKPIELLQKLCIVQFGPVILERLSGSGEVFPRFVFVLSGARQTKQIEGLCAADGFFTSREIRVGEAFIRHSGALAYLSKGMLIARHCCQREDDLEFVAHSRKPLSMFCPEIAVLELSEIERLQFFEKF